MTKAAPLLAALALIAASCGGATERGTATLETERGPVALAVEIADSPDERRRGLQGRTEIPEGSGMIFLFPEDSRGGFWMKDTLVPLSIAFLDASGRILAVLDMEPCAADPCPVYGPGVPYRAALEVARGTFARLGVEAGDVVGLERRTG